MATITYQGNKQIIPGNLEEMLDSVEFADHNGRLVFHAGEPKEIPARLGAVLICGMPANERIPVGGPKRGQPIFKLELTKEELALLTGEAGGTSAPRMEWGPDGDYRAAYENLMAKFPKSIVVIDEPEVKAEDAKAKAAK